MSASAMPQKKHSRKRARAASAANDGLVAHLSGLQAEADPDSYWSKALLAAITSIRKHKSVLRSKAEAMKLAEAAEDVIHLN